MLTRRQFLKVGLGGAAALIAVRAAYAPFGGGNERDARFAYLTAADRGMFAAIARVMLASVLPADERDAAIERLLAELDRIISDFGPSAQSELRDLFSLLQFPPARWLLAGVRRSWAEAEAGEISAFLSDWRLSRWQLLQAAYLALHDLILGTWYGNSAAWRAIGYPGPPALGQP